FAGDMLVGRIMLPVCGHAPTDSGCRKIGHSVLVHATASYRFTCNGRPESALSRKKRLRRFFATSIRYSAEARMSVIGAKAEGSHSSAASPVSRVHRLPASALSTARARFGVAAMPP